ncbi:MAG: apolipoprotein N-acyltransferase [Treponema sp.]|nr:apolipoprotein N-acyltransferase [Treponema sp.]
MKSILQVFFYSIISGLLLSCAIPNELYLLGYPLLTFVAIIPYYFAVKKSPSYKVAFWAGFIQAITTHLVSSYWLAFFKDFAIFTLGGSALAEALWGGILALAAYLPYSLNKKDTLSFLKTKTRFFQNIVFKIFYFSTTWLLFEYVKSIGFLGYPWGTISSAMYCFPALMQIASITGTYGVSFIVVFVNCLLAELFEFYKNKSVYYSPSHKNFFFAQLKTVSIFWIVLFGSAILYGLFQYNTIRIPEKTITSILVQLNTDPWDAYDDDKNILAMEELTKNEADNLKTQNKEPQLIVWSEGALLRTFSDYSTAMYKNNPRENPLIPFIKEMNTPLISGGSYSIMDFTDDDFYSENYNATLMFNQHGELKGFYGKLHLVPFAEYIPGIDNPVINKLLRRVAGISSCWTPGKHLVYFDIPATSLLSKEDSFVQNINTKPLGETLSDDDAKKTTAKIATPICFDDAFTDSMRPLYLNGAEVFFNISDDSWSLQKSSEYQHFTIAAYRAIEYRTTLVRTTNAGYTAVIDPAGKVLADLPLFEKASMNYDVPVYKRQLTLFAILGDWVPSVALIFFIFVCLYSIITFRKTDYIPSERKLKKTKF